MDQNILSMWTISINKALAIYCYSCSYAVRKTFIKEKNKAHVIH